MIFACPVETNSYVEPRMKSKNLGKKKILEIKGNSLVLFRKTKQNKNKLKFKLKYYYSQIFLTLIIREGSDDLYSVSC